MDEAAPSPSWAALLAVLALCGVHLCAGRLRFLESTPRSVWLSFAGGVSVAYIFVHVLPDLSEAQEAVQSAVGAGLGFVEHHVYLVALLGLAAFYGLERAARESRRSNRQDGGEDVTSAGVFWLHIGSFALYNALIGYLLLEREELRSLLVFTLAMALHFVISDFALHEHHKDAYRRTGRWILAAAIFLGWLVGRTTRIPEAAVGVLFAFLAGGVMLNVLKEELPEERQSRFWAFAVGAGGYAALLLAL